jgi:alpha-beta hydrolase superfamily lysophospholipase
MLPPCLLVHGAIENGSIFYSKNGKGLGPYLAESGFDVFVADLRGHGLSTPTIAEEGHKADYGQWETINVSIPSFAMAVAALSKCDQQVGV